MKDQVKYSETEWEEIASYLSGESNAKSNTIDSFLDNRGSEIENFWKIMDKNRGEEKVNVNRAWDKLFARLSEDDLIEKKRRVHMSPWTPFIRIAAILIIIVATTFTLRFVLKDSSENGTIAIATSLTEKNRVVQLPDGSTITLNRNSEITYSTKFEDNTRRVELRGEAFFEITPDASRPFVVDAGKGEIRVLGTSFNVITSNERSQLEVFVKTGKVLLSSNDGDHNVTLEPGYIGTLNGKDPSKELNQNRNYLSWNTGQLAYDGDRLEKVFYDLKRVHNITIEVKSDSILDLQFTTVFNNNTAETIIKSICTSFNLSCEKEGEIYYLSK